MNKNNKFIHMSKPYLDDCELRAVQRVFETGYLGFGNEVEKFENLLSKFFNRGVACVSSGTSAIFLALEALGIGKGDEVIVQSLTYIATYQAIAATGAVPISCDISKHDLSIDLMDAKKKLTSKTKAIIPVHYAGNAVIMNEVIEFAARNNLRIVEDASHAFGSQSKHKLIGSFGDITCFSFDPVKSITCGDGGAIVTDDTSVINRVRKTRMLGIEKKGLKTRMDRRTIAKSVDGLGWRYHMNNISAAIGITQFKKFDFLKKKRQSLALGYINNLESYPGINLFPFNYREIVPYIFVIELKNNNNFKIIDKFAKSKIEVGFHYFPGHLFKYFNNSNKVFLPVTESIYKRLLTLPLHPGLENHDIDLISNHLINIIDKEYA